MADVELLSLADFLFIAEVATRIPAEELRERANLPLAESALVEFVERNGRRWIDSGRDPDESVAMIEAVAAGTLSEAQLATWIRSRVS